MQNFARGSTEISFAPSDSTLAAVCSRLFAPGRDHSIAPRALTPGPPRPFAAIERIRLQSTTTAKPGVSSPVLPHTAFLHKPSAKLIIDAGLCCHGPIKHL